MLNLFMCLFVYFYVFIYVSFMVTFMLFRQNWVVRRENNIWPFMKMCIYLSSIIMSMFLVIAPVRVLCGFTIGQREYYPLHFTEEERKP